MAGLKTVVISAKRKKWLATRLRRIADQDSPAREWQAIASTFRELADHIDAELISAETKKLRRHPREKTRG